MPLRLYNTLSGKVEEFAPAADNTVRMYACGPTVYDYGHIGNFRTFVAVDILRRFLRQSGFKLQHVMNITDVDDKIIRNAARDKKTVQEYTRTYEEAFLEDMGSLNIERPEKLVRATEHIQEMAEFIAKLEKKGIAYRTEDGSYYFRIAKFPEYGKLSKKDFAGMEDGARVDVDEYEKDSARDFALWKAPKEGEAFWESPIGRGRPGWHIECSVMSMKYLGDSFDLHAGGEDLTFPHHENEIAQSESLTGKIFSRHWMHVRFLLVEGEKMSKSLGNFYTLRDLLIKGHKPSSIRFLLTSVPYRKQLNFTFAGLEQHAKSVERLRTFDARIRMSQLPAGTNPAAQEAATKAKSEMRAGMEDDLNTAYASGAIFDMVREANTLADRGELREGDKAPLLEALQQFDEIFAVLKDDDAEKMKAAMEWARSHGILKDSEVPADAMSDADVNRLIEERTAAKKARDFARSDAIRKQLADAGIVVEDTKDGVRWKRAITSPHVGSAAKPPQKATGHETAKEQPKWKRFENLAYEIQKELAGNAAVKAYDHILGVDSKTSRQIDISIRDQVGQYPILVVIECKDYKEPVDVKGVEEFSGLVRDVRANKSAMISSNGFTSAALNVAKNHGIDTFRLLDTSSVDWRSYVTIPALLERTSLKAFSMGFRGIGQMRLPSSTEALANLDLYAGDGTNLGTIKKILHTKWNNKEIPHQPGSHEVVVGNGVTANFQGVTSKLDVSATVVVTRTYYFGPVPIQVRGLENVQTGGIVTRELRTDMIEPHKIETGQVPGWIKIDDPSTLSVRVVFRLGYSDTYGQDEQKDSDSGYQ